MLAGVIVMHNLGRFITDNILEI